MKVAVIGASGFIGNRIVERFHLRGSHEVVPVVRQAASLALPARFPLDWRIADGLHVGSLAAALKDCDAVVHAAIGDPRQIEQMPVALCTAAARAGIRRVVYLSSASVHGQNPPEGSTEASLLHRSHSLDYNNSKVAAEDSFLRKAREYRLSAYALRPGVVYGPRSRWIADLAADLASGRAWLYDDGQGICNAIYVDNLVEAISLCLEAGPGTEGVYLVGDEETVRWADFYHRAADEIGIPRDGIHRVSALPGFHRSFRERVDRTLATPWAQALLPAMPGSWKQTAKRVLDSIQASNGGSAWSLPAADAPRITEEMALLQQCRWKLPHARAASALGYKAPVSFEEGMRRSFSWLRFANGDGVL